MYIRIIGTLWLPEGILNKDLNSFLLEICSSIGFNLRSISSRNLGALIHIVPVARSEAFRAIKLSRFESFRALKGIGA